MTQDLIAVRHVSARVTGNHGDFPMRTFKKYLPAMLVAVLVFCASGAAKALGIHGLHDSISTTDLIPHGLTMAATVTLGNYNETFFAQEALIQLEKVLGMAGRIHRGYSSDTKARGDTISIRRPASFTATDMPATASDVLTDSVNITLNKWKGVVFGLTDKDLSLSADQIITDHIRPATVAIADNVDQACAALYKDIPWVIAQTATPVLADIPAIRKIMMDNRVPLGDKTALHYMIDSTTELAYLNALAAAGQQANTQDPSLREGSMGRLYGFDTWANQNTPSHTSGVAADATGTVDGVNAIGATSLLFSAVTAGITYKIGDTFSIAGDTQRYVVTADGTDADGSAASVSFAPALKVATAGTEVITFTLNGSAKGQNLAFHRNAFALATAPLTAIGNELGAKVAVVADPLTNLSIRSRMWYDGNNAKVMVGLDILYGVKTLDCNLAVRSYDA
jgi:hypothetical protein